MEGVRASYGKNFRVLPRGAIPDSEQTYHLDPCSVAMKWEWELIASLQRKISEEDEVIGPGYHAVRRISDAARGLEEASNLENASEMFLEVMSSSHELMSQVAASSVELRTLRRVYTDAAILRALVLSLRCQLCPAIATLDHSIIVAGPYGVGRLELVLDIIHRLQGEILRGFSSPKPLLNAARHDSISPNSNIISPIRPPSFLRFQMAYSRQPFILRGYAMNWPALTDRPWRSHSYLSSVAGPGRVIPVEVGNDYRTEDWQQKIMEWDEYLTFLDFEDRPSSRSNSSAVYMAQYDLMKQFPKLQDDIVIPDYLYADLESRTFPAYRSPSNDDKRITNAWLGPEGTISPAHIDPYFNFYVQVVGHKRVWLAPPSASNSMYSFPPSDEDNNNNRHLPSSALKNTSRVDVFADAEDMKHFPAFLDQVVPLSLTATLGPGDALFFPPGWWHAMKSASTSFSVSMWF